MFLRKIEGGGYTLDRLLGRIGSILLKALSRRLVLTTGLLFCALAQANPAAAQEATPQSASADPVQIITNQDAGTVTIVIDGKPVVMVDKDGLHVVDNIEYGGTIRDAGQDSVQMTIGIDGAAPEKGAANE